MNMQDKEFDDLFRSKLENFETEPSAQVWQNVDAELDGKKKKSMFPMLGIAASVLILLTAGILFIPKKGAVKHNRPDSNSVAVNEVKPSVVKPDTITPVTEKKQEQVTAVQIAVKHIDKTNQPKIKTNPVEPKEQINPVVAKAGIVKPDEQPVLAVAGTKKTDEVIKPIAIELEPASTVVKLTDDNSAINMQSQPVLALTPTPAAKAVKKRGIRNFGDIVNLVVAKVDKRKDKLIQFSDTDDDESVISAVHLGVLKIKKDN